MADFDLSQFRDLFIDEGQQYLQALNANLLILERDPHDADSLQAMFRAAHSLKGTAATMGYDTLADLAHAMEDLLHKVRSGSWRLDASMIDLLFAAIDALQSLLADAAADRLPTVDVGTVLNQLHHYTPESEPPLPSSEPFSPILPEPGGKAPRPAQPVPDDLGRTTMIRVDVRHLDALLSIVTEMVIHRSLLNRLGQRYQLPDLSEALETHSRTLTQLRDAVLEMRMVPVSQVFDRFPRMVRDLLKAQGKEAQLIIAGADVEMDRTALEALNEPLVHLLRNAIDHGLESPAERLAAGKPPSGALRLVARREQDTVVMEVSDDGRGLDARQIAAVAVERGFVSAEEAAEMSQEQVLKMICHPEFSLSETVTAVSGRGVGMSVVKRQVERLRGSLQIETQVGRGSTFRLQLPIQLSLTDAILLRVGEERYALPMTDVEQIVEIDPTQVEVVGSQQVLTLGDRVVPLRRLSEYMHTPGSDPEPHYALLMRHNGQIVGLGVDAVEGHEEIVVKPLPAALSGLPGLSGVTILGEGQPTLIVDVT